MSALSDLAATIAARKGADPDTSWTARLLAKGPEKAAEKFGEEAVEAIEEKEVRLEKSDFRVDRFGVLWVPVTG